jgi:hypothetical protein
MSEPDSIIFVVEMMTQSVSGALVAFQRSRSRSLGVRCIRKSSPTCEG